MSDESKCTSYVNSSSYDMCKFGELETYYQENLGCSVPYLNSSLPICRNSSATEMVGSNLPLVTVNDQPQAVAAFDNVAGIGNGCREPCVKTVTVFGFPFLSDEIDLDFAYAKLYFKNIVKVTEDHLAYSFLR